MLNRIKRLWLAFKIYSLDITISGHTECIEMVGDPILKFKIEVARSNARSERAALCSEYNSLLPVGKRRTWKLA